MDSSSSTVLRCYGISKHPHTGKYIMVLPFAHGGSLSDYLRKRAKRLSWVNRLDILRFMLYGLADIHSKDMVHRDFHPGNLLHYRKTISVADLGQSGPIYVNEEPQTVGVLPYMAPEVLNRKPYTKAADIYSVGMIMWLLTSGQHPFSDRPHDLELAIDICKNVRPEIIKGTPQVYEYWMKKCWDPEPENRPTARELYQEVLNWLNKFNKDPSSEVVQQFTKKKLKSLDRTYAFNIGGQYTSNNYDELSKKLVEHNRLGGMKIPV